MNLAKLAEPFAPTDIEWRVGQAGKNAKGVWAKVLAYVTNRAIMDRLDSVCGPENWKNEFRHDGPAVMCGLSIKIGDEWVTKWDGAENTDIEAVKGGLSGAMKRAGVQWGIGRYLYDLEEGWAVVSENGIHYAGAGKNKDGSEKHPAFRWSPPQLPKWAMPNVTVGGDTNRARTGVAPSVASDRQSSTDAVEEPSTARGAQPDGKRDAALPEATGNEVVKEPHVRVGGMSAAPAPSGATKRARLNQKNVNTLLVKAGSPDALKAAVTRALGGIEIERITDAKQWPEMDADDYERLTKEIALAQMPPAIDAESRSLETLLDDAKHPAKDRREAIMAAANKKLMPLTLMRNLVNVATHGRETELRNVVEDEELETVRKAVEAWS